MAGPGAVTGMGEGTPGSKPGELSLVAMTALIPNDTSVASPGLAGLRPGARVHRVTELLCRHCLEVILDGVVQVDLEEHSGTWVSPFSAGAVGTLGNASRRRGNESRFSIGKVIQTVPDPSARRLSGVNR